MQPFVQRLHINGGDLSRRAVDVLQVNMGRYCNQACIHCHVESGPTRNELGYGETKSDLILNLVYNPVGPHLPPPQQKLEHDYKRILKEQFGIVFNHLYCLTNMPITRYETHLKLRGEYERYMELLESSFNPATLEQVMCRNLVSIGWEGTIYDCDFNQMLELPIRDPEGNALHVSSLSLDQLLNQPIAVGNHCYACTAGSGSSCGGVLVS